MKYLTLENHRPEIESYIKALDLKFGVLANLIGTDQDELYERVYGYFWDDLITFKRLTKSYTNNDLLDLIELFDEDLANNLSEVMFEDVKLTKEVNSETA